MLKQEEIRQNKNSEIWFCRTFIYTSAAAIEKNEKLVTNIVNKMVPKNEQILKIPVAFVSKETPAETCVAGI